MELWLWTLSIAVMVLVSTSVMGLLRWLWPDQAQQRLIRSAPDALAPAPSRQDWVEHLPARLRGALARISRWSLPARTGAAKGPAAADPTLDALALRLQRAGWRSPHALWLWGVSKSLLTLVGLAFGAAMAWGLGQPLGSVTGSALPVLGAASGHWLPDAWMRWRTAQRRHELMRAFPDALDMLRICVQAGLGLDAAIERVGREMRLSSPALSEQWRLTGLALRAGASRRMALQQLAERVDLREIDAMVTMLIQADRFGTRMSEALEVHAQGLRTRRRQQAEAAAAQLPVKLLFPLIFCIFPALLTVMLGPVGLSLYEHFGRVG